MSSPASLFSHRGFLRLWWSRLAGTAGSQMLMIGVGWQMYDLTASARELGFVGLLQLLPALLLVLVPGHVVDRLQRARLLAACLAFQAAIAALLCAAVHGAVTREWLLLSAALGTLWAFQKPAQKALTPSLIPGG